MEKCVHVAVNLHPQLVCEYVLSFIYYFTFIRNTSFHPWSPAMVTLLVIHCAAPVMEELKGYEVEIAVKGGTLKILR